MSHGHPHASPPPEPSIRLSEGWHCSHLYYHFDRAELARMESKVRQQGCEAVVAALDPERDQAPVRMQTSIVSGNKADFGLMLMDPDPLVIDAAHQLLMSGPLGPAIRPAYSFVSITQLSEYVPSLEQYAERLVEDGEVEGSEAFEAKKDAYRRREPIMRKQRLTPDFPDWPVTCFYPMSKKRKVGENWFTLPFDERNRMMHEHAKSGMAFAGKAKQLITVGVGLEDWEWGVTLWGANPEFLTDIVYKMRFDEASARYAEFGPFYTSYITTPAAMLEHCRISG